METNLNVRLMDKSDLEAEYYIDPGWQGSGLGSALI